MSQNLFDRALLDMEVAADAEPEAQTEMEKKSDQVLACSLWKPVRRKFAADADFFHDGDISCGLMRKLPLPDDKNSNGDLHSDANHSEDQDRYENLCVCLYYYTVTLRPEWVRTLRKHESLEYI